MYCSISRWPYFRATTSFEKRGVGVFSRVGLFSGDYGILFIIHAKYIIKRKATYIKVFELKKRQVKSRQSPELKPRLESPCMHYPTTELRPPDNR